MLITIGYYIANQIYLVNGWASIAPSALSAPSAPDVYALLKYFLNKYKLILFYKEKTCVQNKHNLTTKEFLLTQ